jgi:hypothetical protein
MCEYVLFWLVRSFIAFFLWIYCICKKKSVPITTKVVSLNPAHGKVDSIQHYAIKSVSDMQQVSGFLQVFRFPPPRKQMPRYNWNIVEIEVKLHNPLLKINCLSIEFLKTFISFCTIHTAGKRKWFASSVQKCMYKAQQYSLMFHITTF